MRRPRALVFDLDGTLVDSKADIAAACNVALREHGAPPLPVERIFTMIGDGARALVARALAASGADGDVDRVLATFQARYLERPAVHTTLLPGASEVLASGISAAIVTNKPRDIAEAVLDALGVRGAFAVVFGGGDGPLKPSPAGVLHVLERLAVAPGDAWMIGDGAQDVGAGRAAGCFTVAVPGIAEHASVVASGPDAVVGSLHDVVRMILTAA
ncbi:MAG: HAD-IA family hydrolase [Labilithrix sp.]|nr:HAD-IA family hydrolase [Labilithrix sp.]